MIRYCVRCLYPDTKPDLWFDAAGVCSGCLSFAARTAVDWAAREVEFLETIGRFRSREGRTYDCIVPVSGGKDSHFQVLRLLEHGLNPLAVTATTDSLSDIGRRNLQNLQRLGVDHVEVTCNPVVRRRINRLGLEQVGDISWPEHVTIFTTPVRIAVQMRIPLIVWGENPQNEYGGPPGSGATRVLDRRWLEEYGGLLGLRVSDLVGQAGIQPHHLIPYTFPAESEVAAVGVTGLFLGYFFAWDGYTNALYAQAHGLETLGRTVEGSMVDYENLDNHQTGIHDYFKFLKFGFGRATDLASSHIRRGRLSRAGGLRLVRRHDGRYPATYLGRPLADILAEIGMGPAEFDRICDQFTTRRLFVCDAKGRPVRDAAGNLTKINDDNSR
ncbi:MAG: N-acetyl sugar amidotransferase [Alphaproteobacteria bacterium]|nr:N-acetyl sugar amidotransferase [Alphaproteobacteria bacterium]